MSSNVTDTVSLLVDESVTKSTSPKVPAIRVLIVEDTNIDFVFICKVLQLLDNQCFHISRATSVNDAISLLHKESFDVCLVDYILADGTGVDLISAVQAMEWMPPFILLTGNDDQGLDVKAIQAGAGDYLCKSSIDPRTMERCIRYAIERHRAIQPLANATRQLADEVVERRQAEAREALLGRIIEDSLTEIYVFDAQTLKFRNVNRGARENLGYSLDDLKTMTPLDLNPDFENESFQQHIQPLVDGISSVVRFETRHRRKDGSLYSVGVNLQLSRADTDAQFVAIARDITEHNRTAAELHKLQQEHLESSRQAGKAEIATGVLHNVGNVLNSVNVSVNLLTDRLITGRSDKLQKAVAMLEEHADDPGSFFTSDEKGRRLPTYLRRLSESLSEDRDFMLAEVESLCAKIDHIKEVVQLQQTHAKRGGHIETIELSDLVETALTVNEASLGKHGIDIQRQFDDVPAIETDKHLVLQVLVNLISNAKNAITLHGSENRNLTIRLNRIDDSQVRVEVQDSGDGVAPENLDRIFTHGFTTRGDGHGFGLHSSANSATELGGTLTVFSEGPGQGATFTLQLPISKETSCLV